MRGEVFRFLIAGGSAAAINWLSRIALSLVMPFGWALAGAYLIGMVAGFLLYRNFVFRAAAGTLRRQLPVFLVVNLMGAVVVVGASAAGLAALARLWPGLPQSAAEALAHGLAIGIGAGANFAGHRLLTFAAPRQLDPVLGPSAPHS